MRWVSSQQQLLYTMRVLCVWDDVAAFILYNISQKRDEYTK